MMNRIVLENILCSEIDKRKCGAPVALMNVPRLLDCNDEAIRKNPIEIFRKHNHNFLSKLFDYDFIVAGNNVRKNMALLYSGYLMFEKNTDGKIVVSFYRYADGIATYIYENYPDVGNEIVYDLENGDGDICTYVHDRIMMSDFVTKKIFNCVVRRSFISLQIYE